jgi:Ohr subfamily peroxiredoxin
MTMKPLYTAVATAHGGREGRVRSDDGKIDQALSMPKELGGGGGAGTNPEQLFAAGYSACFESALRLTARMQKRTVTDASITARVTIGSDNGSFRLAVELHGHLPGMSEVDAMGLMEAAHQVCPYSHATRGNVEVKLSASTETEAKP